MKRVIIILLLIISILLGYSLVTKGFAYENLDFSISSYKEIGEKSEDLTRSVAAYNKKNNVEYAAMLNTLTSVRTKYEKAKSDYEDLLAELGTEEQINDGISDEIIIASSLPVYEIDFLWTTIGNYAKKRGLTITMDVNEASSPATSKIGYGLYNLNFILTGQYIDIADFISEIENDDQLGFEIRNYDMLERYATFTILNVPLNPDTLVNSQMTTDTEATENTNDQNNTTNINSVTDTNTNNVSANSDTNSNSINNETTNTVNTTNINSNTNRVTE